MDDSARPLLTQVRAKHFKSLGDLSLDLGPLTVLVGPNGSGKSNVVAVLRFLRDAATRGLNYAFGEQGGSVTIPYRGYARVGVGATYESGLGRAVYDLTLSQLENPLEHETETLWLHGARSYFIRRALDGSSKGSEYFGVLTRPREVSLLAPQALVPATEDVDAWKAVELADRLFEQVARMGIYLFNVHNLRHAQREAHEAPLEEDGSNLAAVLSSLQETRDGDTIDQVVGQLVEGATGYHVEQAASFLVPFIDYDGYADGGIEKFDLGLESDGTIRMMAMLAALYQTPPRSLVVLEEPEAGLHPGVLSALAGIIKEASTRTQVLITTHSPDLIDCFDVDVLRVVEKVNGETRVGPVRPQQREAVRRKLFSPGELMRMEGLQLDLES